MENALDAPGNAPSVADAVVLAASLRPFCKFAIKTDLPLRKVGFLISVIVDCFSRLFE